MDVVKNTVEALKGKVEVKTEKVKEVNSYLKFQQQLLFHRVL